MKQGCTYTVSIPAGLGSDASSGEVKFDIWNTMSEAVHVNILGYLPSEPVKEADLYLWLGEGGQRDYKSFQGKGVYLYNVATGKSKKVGTVKYWKPQSASEFEAGRKDLTGSDVWNIDFKESVPGRYRLVVEGVGCSMDFDIKDDVYFQPYRYSVRGYYYMRIGEPIDPEHVYPVPRQPQFLPEVDPKGFTVYKTDLHPWHPDWRKLRGDVWDEPHFKPALESAFWQHRLPGNPVNIEMHGGHSDAMDWDRHLAHVSNIFDMLLPYILTNGRISEDNLGIRGRRWRVCRGSWSLPFASPSLSEPAPKGKAVRAVAVFAPFRGTSPRHIPTTSGQKGSSHADAKERNRRLSAGRDASARCPSRKRDGLADAGTDCRSFRDATSRDNKAPGQHLQERRTRPGRHVFHFGTYGQRRKAGVSHDVLQP